MVPSWIFFFISDILVITFCMCADGLMNYFLPCRNIIKYTIASNNESTMLKSYQFDKFFPASLMRVNPSRILVKDRSEINAKGFFRSFRLRR